MARLKILFSVSECFPFAKTGGLGDVAGALPLALRARGHDVRIVMPRYRSTKRFASTLLSGPLGIPMGWGVEWVGVHRADVTSHDAEGTRVPLYLLEHEGFFDRDGVYGDKSGGFGDNLERYGLLSRGTLELCRYLGFEPDVIHVHDWPTSLVPIYLDTIEKGRELERAASVLSIHNMAYQGWFTGGDAWKVGLVDAGLAAELGLTLHGSLNLLKGGIEHATIVSTVSPKYAHEIQSPEGGEGLDGLLRARGGDVIGVLNGIDEHAWDPARDKHTAAPFSYADLSGKALCKAALQRELGLAERPDVPLVGLVSRLVAQKGIDVFAEALPRILATGAQVVVLGSGESWAETSFTALSHATESFRAWIGMNEGLAHRIEAGADLFLMPSRYEPCGLNQMYSQRYGTLPVVRAVGGLDDTVDNGVTGFKFQDLTADALANTVAWAVSTYRNDPGRFRAMQQRSMLKPLGWSHAARQYEALYRLAVGKRRGRI
jgi:starch synthase